MVGLIGREGGVNAIRSHFGDLADLETGIAQRRREEVERTLSDEGATSG